MCRPASFVLTRDKVFWSKNSESHEGIVKEFGLNADGVRGTNILRVEISPENEDLSTPIDQWVFRFDQDVMPEWYSGDDHTELRTRAALTDWYDTKVISQNSKVKKGQYYAIGKAMVEVFGTAQVDAYNSTVIKAYNSSVIYAYDSSDVYAQSHVRVYSQHNATVVAYGPVTIEARHNSTVKAFYTSVVNAYDSTTIKQCSQNSIIRYYSDQPLPQPQDNSIIIDFTKTPKQIIQA